MSPAARAWLADDQALVRAGFRVLLDSADDITVVGEATNGGEAVAQAYPTTSAQAGPTAALVRHLRSDVLPAGEEPDRTPVPV